MSKKQTNNEALVEQRASISNSGATDFNMDAVNDSVALYSDGYKWHVLLNDIAQREVKRMSLWGDLRKAGIESDGVNVDIFNGNLTARNVLVPKGNVYYVDQSVSFYSVYL